MEEQEFINNFIDCISIKSSIDDDFIVIYPLDLKEPMDGEVKHNEILIVQGYLMAAEIIVKSIGVKHSKAIPYEDRLALPLLLLYFCSFEFCLKLLKKKLDNHKKCNTCHVFKKSNKEVKNNHNLCNLIKYLKESFPDKNKLHSFNGFKKIENFIGKVCKYGVTSESTRYCYDKEQKVLPLHSKQTYVYYKKLHKNVETIVNQILDYIYSKDFDLCEMGEFSQSKIKELKSSELIMEQKELAILNFLERTELPETANGIVTFSDIKDEICRYSEEKNEFLNDHVKALDQQQLASLTLGLYFVRSPDTIPDLQFFERLRREELEEKIMSKIHLFKEAYGCLVRHIQYLENVFNNRL